MRAFSCFALKQAKAPVTVGIAALLASILTASPTAAADTDQDPGESIPDVEIQENQPGSDKSACSSFARLHDPDSVEGFKFGISGRSNVLGPAGSLFLSKSRHGGQVIDETKSMITAHRDGLCDDQ